MNEFKPKGAYLGDSVYAEYDGYHIILYVGNGISKRNAIYLDERVLANLKRYEEFINKEREEYVTRRSTDRGTADRRESADAESRGLATGHEPSDSSGDDTGTQDD